MIFCLLIKIITLNAIQFLYFEVDNFYSPEDFRVKTYKPPFPLICHYKEGDTSTECSEFRINLEKPQLSDIPVSLKEFIAKNKWNNIE